MTDIFDTTIICKKCGKPMEQTIVNRQGLELRAVRCHKCGDTIVHPADANELVHFNNLKDKTFNVKLRMVGNSHAISIPKEIIDFMEEQHRTMRTRMDDMVRLCFEDFDRLSISFGDEDEEEQ
jgi:DNA-directed RNA polymerase subunit RPC12/RpoP